MFAFTTRAEVGFHGAAALAAELGPNVRRVYAADTFVASDARLESHRFAHTPPGAVDVPLSRPGRYSHSPVETLDLRDLRALARLVAALAA